MVPTQLRRGEAQIGRQHGGCLDQEAIEPRLWDADVDIIVPGDEPAVARCSE